MGTSPRLPASPSSTPPLTRWATSVPPQAWFGVSAVFHYLGPSFAVLLFPAVGVFGVAWLRIASAALVFAAWRNPWHSFRAADHRTRWLLIAFGLCLAGMNSCFYLALARLPMSLVAAMEFVGTIAVALYGLRSRRNVAALALAILGVFLLIEVKWSSDLAGLFWSFLNGALFVCYILLGHRIAASGASDGVARLGTAMAIAFIVILPVGLGEAIKAFGSVQLLLAASGVGLCSSVIPYICDQFAMSRLPRTSFALMLALLPATATLIGIIVLAQMPSLRDLLGILLVMSGVALHKPAAPHPPSPETITVSCPGA